MSRIFSVLLFCIQKFLLKEFQGTDGQFDIIPCIDVIQIVMEQFCQFMNAIDQCIAVDKERLGGVHQGALIIQIAFQGIEHFVLIFSAFFPEIIDIRMTGLHAVLKTGGFYDVVHSMIKKFKIVDFRCQQPSVFNGGGCLFQ